MQNRDLHIDASQGYNLKGQLVDAPSSWHCCRRSSSSSLYHWCAKSAHATIASYFCDCCCMLAACCCFSYVSNTSTINLPMLCSDSDNWLRFRWQEDDWYQFLAALKTLMRDKKDFKRHKRQENFKFKLENLLEAPTSSRHTSQYQSEQNLYKHLDESFVIVCSLRARVQGDTINSGIGMWLVVV